MSNYVELDLSEYNDILSLPITSLFFVFSQYCRPPFPRADLLMTIHLYTQPTTKSPASSSSSSSISSSPPTNNNRNHNNPSSEDYHEGDVEQSTQPNPFDPDMILSKENQLTESAFESHEIHVDDLFKSMLYFA